MPKVIIGLVPVQHAAQVTKALIDPDKVQAVNYRDEISCYIIFQGGWSLIAAASLEVIAKRIWPHDDWRDDRTPEEKNPPAALRAGLKTIERPSTILTPEQAAAYLGKKQ